MEFTKEEMLDIVASVKKEYEQMVKNETQTLEKNENEETLEKYEYDQEDMEKMYMEMDKQEMSDHHSALNKAMEKMGMHAMKKEEKEDKEEEKEKEEGKKKDKESMDKKEDMEKSEKSSEEKELLVKSEQLEKELANKDKEINELKETLKKSAEENKTFQEELNKFMKLIGADKEEVPSQKSVTSLDFIAKSENDETGKSKEFKVEKMSKSEVKEILAKKSADPATKTEDRRKINAYFLENTDINEIKHLLQGE